MAVSSPPASGYRHQQLSPNQSYRASLPLLLFAQIIASAQKNELHIKSRSRPIGCCPEIIVLAAFIDD